MNLYKSKLSLGTVQFGLDYGINNKSGKVKKNTVFEIFDFCINEGINTLDTSYLYGDSESVIGEYNKFSDNNFNIISKLPSLKKNSASFYLHESLQRLNRNRLYGYLVHHFNFFRENPKIWDELKKLKEIGKIEKIGFSLYFPEEYEYLSQLNIKPDILQFPYSIFDQRFSYLFSRMKEQQIEIHTRSTFLQGLIFKNPNEITEKFILIKNKIIKLNNLSSELNIPIYALCLNFTLINSYIDKLIIGVDNINNLSDNLNALMCIDQTYSVYNKLQELKEDNEEIILPINWSK